MKTVVAQWRISITSIWKRYIQDCLIHVVKRYIQSYVSNVYIMFIVSSSSLCFSGGSLKHHQEKK